jgi:hypothetical protein
MSHPIIVLQCAAAEFANSEVSELRVLEHGQQQEGECCAPFFGHRPAASAIYRGGGGSREL